MEVETTGQVDNWMWSFFKKKKEKEKKGGIKYNGEVWGLSNQKDGGASN